MTRDELEAVIWRNWPRHTQATGAVDTILAAADAYRATPKPPPASGPTPTQLLMAAERRAVLAAADTDGCRPYGDYRERDEAMGLDPWTGGAA